jgi:hypothetical protein
MGIHRNFTQAVGVEQHRHSMSYSIHAQEAPREMRVRCTASNTGRSLFHPPAYLGSLGYHRAN